MAYPSGVLRDKRGAIANSLPDSPAILGGYGWSVDDKVSFVSNDLRIVEVESCAYAHTVGLPWWASFCPKIMFPVEARWMVTDNEAAHVPLGRIRTGAMRKNGGKT